MTNKAELFSEQDLKSVFEKDHRFNIHPSTEEKLKALKQKAKENNISHDELGEILLEFITKLPSRNNKLPHPEMMELIHEDLKEEFPKLDI